MAHLTPTFDALIGSARKTEGRRDAAVKRVTDTEDRIEDLKGEEAILARVGDLFRALIDKEVISNVKAAEALITEGLATIFDDMDISVRTEVDVQRGKVSVDLVTVQRHADGTVTEGPASDAYGGSVSTVESALMRVVVLSRRNLRPLLLLDESLGAVAEHYVPRVGRFLALLCEKMDMDILTVTHNPVLVEAANRAYRIQKQGGEASFRSVRTGS